MRNRTHRHHSVPRLSSAIRRVASAAANMTGISTGNTNSAERFVRSGILAARALRGVPIGGVRAPLLDPRPDDREAIQKRLKELKLL